MSCRDSPLSPIPTIQSFGGTDASMRYYLARLDEKLTMLERNVEVRRPKDARLKLLSLLSFPRKGDTVSVEQWWRGCAVNTALHLRKKCCFNAT